MKRKTLIITYWVVTLLFVAVNALSGISELFPNQQAFDMMARLGYPLYFLTILGVAKILGSIAIVQTKYKTVKEWAYAGFTIDYISAAASFAFIGGAVFEIVMPFVFLGFLALSYYLWKRYEAVK